MVDNRPWFDLLWKLCLVFVILNSCHVVGKKASHWQAPRPHIIMIVADDLGWDDVSFHGSPQIPTPHIDKLANEGVILNSYYVSPICTPTRASLMTGKHPVNLGVQHATIFGTQPYGLPLGVATTPQYLKSLGYRTHGVGKWHLGFFEKEYTPTYRGFETYYGFWNGKEDYWDHSSQEDVWGTDLRNNMKPVKNESGHYGTELYTEIAERIIDTHNKSEPLYLYLAQQAVHSANEHEPLQAPQRLLDNFPHFSSDERRTYAAMVASLDESVGNITKALKKKGLYDNAVIVFTTDNGGAPRGFNWNQGCNFPFKGGKDTFWEGGVRGVGFVHSNLIKNKARVSYDMIDVTDWLPTFYHLAGGDVTAIQDKIDGMNVWDTIAHGKKSPRTEVLHNIDPIRKFAAIRVKQYKLIINQDAVFKTTWHSRYEVTGELDSMPQPSTLPGAVIKCGEWKKSKTAACDTNVFPCLFNIEQDPCEFNNLAHSNLDKVQQLLQKLIKYQKDALPVWFPVRDPIANPAVHTGDDKGFWGPWMSSTANEAVLKEVLDRIPKFSEKKQHQASHRTDNGTQIGKVFSTHSEHDNAVYEMLKGILRLTNGGKKGLIPRNNSAVMKESLAMLYAKMKQKTKVDDLMHKLQMIKKGRVAKSKGHRSGEESSKSEAHSASHSDSKFPLKKDQKVDKNGAKRNDIDSFARNEDRFSENSAEADSLDKNSVLGEEERQIEDALSLDASADTEKVEQTDFKTGESMNENDSQLESESIPEDESSGQSVDITSETSIKGSGNEFQEGSVTDDAGYDNYQ